MAIEEKFKSKAPIANDTYRNYNIKKIKYISEEKMDKC